MNSSADIFRQSLLIEVKININTNASENEKKKLHVPREAIDEFLGEGFASNTYEGDISFKCMPRAIDPSWMEVVVNLKDILETGVVLATVIRALVKLFKKCSGYEQTITIDYQKNNKKFSCSIHIDKNSNEEKILKEIRKMMLPPSQEMLPPLKFMLSKLKIDCII